MKALNYKYYLIIALSIITIASCSKDDAPDEFIPEYLVASEQVVELSKDDILAQLGGGNMLPDEIEFLIRYGVKGLRLTYTTIDTQGNSVEVSGALLVPIGNFLKPLISFQHGTITSDDLAPSNFGSDADIMAFMLASTGFVIAMPDYIGYGVSKHLPHPYEHRATLAYATRDMIRAAREYFKLNNLEQLDGKLFMTGYSEGGTATMAAFQLMQQDHSSEFDITAVTVGAGAYNKSEFMDWVVSSTEP
ncbi:MAG: lipase family protein, partial [Tenuifilaceae bacterium]|nr:lipase family protein [Tenuifilaceae bacterium]